MNLYFRNYFHSALVGSVDVVVVAVCSTSCAHWAKRTGQSFFVFSVLAFACFSAGFSLCLHERQLYITILLHRLICRHALPTINVHSGTGWLVCVSTIARRTLVDIYLLPVETGSVATAIGQRRPFCMQINSWPHHNFYSVDCLSSMFAESSDQAIAIDNSQSFPPLLRRQYLK